MPSSKSVAVRVLQGCALILCCPCLCCLVRWGKRGRRGICVRYSWSPQRPLQTLPQTRIDIRQLALAGSEQPEACHLLRLPLELRQRIYEQVLGGRVVYVHLFAARDITVVGSKYYQSINDPNDDPQGLDTPAEKISTSMLLSCRQVYLEAQPIIYQRNTFYFSVHELELVVLGGLGKFNLPDIRSVYLYHSYRTTSYVPPWATVFTLLQQMNLTHLVFEFELSGWTRWTEYNPRVDVLNSTWTRRVLGFRNLNQFGLFFKDGSLPENPVYRPDIVQKYRERMIGPQAEEGYRDFLEKWDENRIKYPTDPYLHV